MTDEQILKRLAEIAGIKIFYGRLPSGDPVSLYADENGGFEWNPLTNWSDLGPLIEKYFIDITAPNPDYVDDVWIAVTAIPDTSAGANESLPHAICLAIIEANGGMGDE